MKQYKLQPLKLHFAPHSLSPPSRKPLHSLYEKSTSRIQGLDNNFEYILKFAVRTKGNPNRQNQDSFIVCPNIANKTYMHFFLVCDGHGAHGHIVSKFLKQQFPIYIEKLKIQLEHNPTMAIQNIFLLVSKALLSSSIDCQFSGSTVVGVFMLHNKVFCCNLGDSRAMMLSRTNKWFIKNLTRDHKPDFPDEATRILNLGGRIEPYRDQHGQPQGPLRVWVNNSIPGLAMTRSMGDRIAKTVGVIDQPEIFNFTIEKMDRVILICSDGVFEFLSQSDILDAIAVNVDKMDIETACNNLLETAINSWEKRNANDDITFILLFLQY